MLNSNHYICPDCGSVTSLNRCCDENAWKERDRRQVERMHDEWLVLDGLADN